MFVLNLLLLGIPLAVSENVTVITQSGPVIGYVDYVSGIQIYKFLGIPFAKPPVGDQRFRKPQPIEPWSEPIYSESLPPNCIDFFYFSSHFYNPVESEDCLFLNIWAPAPKSPQESTKAVMFYIYSGSPSSSNNNRNNFRGEKIAAYGDVIFVSAQYRLGILGFLSMGTDDAPGNMGLFDLLTALKWVHENIEAFGGDKNRITVFGQGQGAVLSALIAMSPLTRGLFQRIIMDSGAPFPLAGNTRLRNLILAQQTADAVGCSQIPTVTYPPSTVVKPPSTVGKPPSAIVKPPSTVVKPPSTVVEPPSTVVVLPSTVVECFRTQDAMNLSYVANSFHNETPDTFLPISGDSFLPIDPTTALKTGFIQDVDVLTGVVQDEGSNLLVNSFRGLFGFEGRADPKINKTLGRELILKMLDGFYFKDQVADHYLSGLDEDDYLTVRRQTWHSKGDLSVVCPVLYFAETFSQLNKGRTYFYYFYHHVFTFYPRWLGVTHFSEFPYVLGLRGEGLGTQLLTLWTNYAKNGNPSTEWKEFSKQDPYIQNFYVKGDKKDKSTLKQHLENCDFYRPYLLSQ